MRFTRRPIGLALWPILALSVPACFPSPTTAPPAVAPAGSTTLVQGGPKGTPTPNNRKGGLTWNEAGSPNPYINAQDQAAAQAASGASGAPGGLSGSASPAGGAGSGASPSSGSSASPSAGASTSPSPTGSASGTVSASPSSSSSASPSASASVTPSPNPTPTPAPTTTLSGTVYDEQGVAVAAGAQITVTSLNPSQPYSATVAQTAGSYAFPQVPIGVQLMITAAKTTWTTRTRIATSAPNMTVNFGGANVAAADPSGSFNFLSSFPEIVSVAAAQVTLPNSSSTINDASQISLTITLSEALFDIPSGPQNRTNFVNSLLVVPGTAPATNTNVAPPVLDVPNASVNATNSTTATVSNFPYNARFPASFLGANAQTSWDPTGHVLVYTFQVPLINRSTSAASPASYYLALASAGTTSGPVDPAGHQLGTDAANSTTSYPPVGGLVNHAFKRGDLTFDPAQVTTASARWAATHDNAYALQLAPDSTPPGITGLRVGTYDFTNNALNAANPNGLLNAITLAFNKPVYGYDAASGFSNGALNPANYSFRIGTDANLDYAAWDENAANANLVSRLGDVSFSQPFRLNFANPNFLVYLNPLTPTQITFASKDPVDTLPNGMHAIRVKIGPNWQDLPGQAIATPTSGFLTSFLF